MISKSLRVRLLDPLSIAEMNRKLSHTNDRLNYIDSGEWLTSVELTPENVTVLAGGQDAPLAIRSFEDGHQVLHYCIVNFREGRPRIYSAVDGTPIDGLCMTGWLPARYFSKHWQARKELDSTYQ